MTTVPRYPSADECERVRELLWPLDGPRAWVEGEQEARAHLEACAACQAFFRCDALIGRALHGLDVIERAPGDLRERVFDALARERAMSGGRRGAPGHRPWNVRRAMWTAGGVVVVALGLLAFPRGSEGGSAFARDYLSRAVQERRIDRADSAQISEFFVREFGQAIEPRHVAQAQMARAMICLIDGRRAAMVEYIADGRAVSHYRIPLGAGAGRQLSGARTESDGGVHAVRWSDDRFEHALVSNLPLQDLERFARTEFAAR